jgi:hypothetical protein
LRYNPTGSAAQEAAVGARFVLRLMFEWGGGCLWCGNDAARERFDVGPIEDRLPLTLQTRRRLQELSAWHDGALNWGSPSDPSPWSADERKRFEQAAGEVLSVLRAELGSELEVVYQAL